MSSPGVSCQSFFKGQMSFSSLGTVESHSQAVILKPVINYNYFAINYLDDWCDADRRFVDGLCFSRTGDERLACLWKAAKYYKVTRTLPVINEERRLGRALEAIDAINNQITEETVGTVVCDLERTFKRVYGKNALSAASKFLWIRHRSPVVIYDGQACTTLKRLGAKFNHAAYTSYRREWLTHFAMHEPAIRAACAELHRVKFFSLARDMSDDEVAAITAERWFHERVFDKFLWQTGA